MKRNIKITLLAVFFILSVNGQNNQILADETVKITSSQTLGRPGETVAVTFSVADNPGTIMYEMKIGYDTDVLEVMSVEDGKYYPEWFDTDISRTPLYISAGDALSLENLTDSCELATIYFKISDQAEAGEYRFTVEDGLFLNGELEEYKVDYDNSGCILVKDSGMNAASSEKNNAEENTERQGTDGNISGEENSSQENKNEIEDEKQEDRMIGDESEGGVEKQGISDDSGKLDEKGSTAQEVDEEQKSDHAGRIGGALIAIALVILIAGGFGVRWWKQKRRV